MNQGIVISLEILVIEMGDRGSKSDLIKKSVKEQRVDGSSVLFSILWGVLLSPGKPVLGIN
jgi:hypothetical protein